MAKWLFLQAGQDLDRPFADKDNRDNFRAWAISLIHFFHPANKSYFSATSARDRRASPSTRTVHAPHSPKPQRRENFTM